MANPLSFEKVCFSRTQLADAEANWQRKVSGASSQSGAVASSEPQASGIVGEIQQIRQQIRSKLSDIGSSPALDPEAMNRISALEEENKKLRKVTDQLSGTVARLEERLARLETTGGKQGDAPKPAAPSDKADDSDEDLFGSSSDEEDNEELERIKAERLAAYQAKKATKKQVIAKSSVIFDVKPYSDETDMAQMESMVRAIEKDGLLWGSSKLVDVAYGIKKLQITCVVEDDKVSTDELEEDMSFEDIVQSVDIVAFNKI